MPEPTRQSSTRSVCVVFCTCPDGHNAERIADALVNEGLAACVNQLPGIQSTYLWEGKLTRDQEMLLLIKTTDDRLADLEARIGELHPYELPEVLAVPDCGGANAYLDWVRTTVSPTSRAPESHR